MISEQAKKLMARSRFPDPHKYLEQQYAMAKNTPKKPPKTTKGTYVDEYQISKQTGSSPNREH